MGTFYLLTILLVYLSFALAALVSYVATKTRIGLVIKAVGENPHAANAIGIKVLRVRYCAVMFGGAMAGLSGAYMSLVYTPMWIENMTSGRGWIALALVVFASWRVGRIMLGAYLFGFGKYYASRFTRNGLEYFSKPSRYAALCRHRSGHGHHQR